VGKQVKCGNFWIAPRRRIVDLAKIDIKLGPLNRGRYFSHFSPKLLTGRTTRNVFEPDQSVLRPVFTGVRVKTKRLSYERAERFMV
jgi:hypothetical protein